MKNIPKKISQVNQLHTHSSKHNLGRSTDFARSKAINQSQRTLRKAPLEASSHSRPTGVVIGSGLTGNHLQGSRTQAYPSPDLPRELPSPSHLEGLARKQSVGQITTQVSHNLIATQLRQSTGSIQRQPTVNGASQHSRQGHDIHRRLEQLLKQQVDLKQHIMDEQSTLAQLPNNSTSGVKTNRAAGIQSAFDVTGQKFRTPQMTYRGGGADAELQDVSDHYDDLDEEPSSNSKSTVNEHSIRLNMVATYRSRTKMQQMKKQKESAIQRKLLPMSSINLLPNSNSSNQLLRALPQSKTTLAHGSRKQEIGAQRGHVNNSQLHDFRDESTVDPNKKGTIKTNFSQQSAPRTDKKQSRQTVTTHGKSSQNMSIHLMRTNVKSPSLSGRNTQGLQMNMPRSNERVTARGGLNTSLLQGGALSTSNTIVSQTAGFNHDSAIVKATSAYYGGDGMHASTSTNPEVARENHQFQSLELTAANSLAMLKKLSSIGAANVDTRESVVKKPNSTTGSVLQRSLPGSKTASKPGSQVMSRVPSNGSKRSHGHAHQVKLNPPQFFKEDQKRNSLESTERLSARLAATRLDQQQLMNSIENLGGDSTRNAAQVTKSRIFQGSHFANLPEQRSFLVQSGRNNHLSVNDSSKFPKSASRPRKNTMDEFTIQRQNQQTIDHEASAWDEQRRSDDHKFHKQNQQQVISRSNIKFNNAQRFVEINEKQVEKQFLNQMSRYLSVAHTHSQATNIDQLREAFDKYLQYKKLKDDFATTRIDLIDHKGNGVQTYLIHYLVQNCITQDILEYLLKPALLEGLSITVVNAHDEGVLHLNFKRQPCTSLCCSVTQLLLEHGADPNQTSKNGANVLHLICQRDEVSSTCACLMSVLNSSKFNSKCLTALNSSGMSPFHFAIVKGREDFVLQFLEHGCSPLEPTAHRITPMQLACQVITRQRTGGFKLLQHLVQSLIKSHGHLPAVKGKQSLDELDRLIADVELFDIGGIQYSEVAEAVSLLLQAGIKPQTRHLQKMQTHLKSNRMNTQARAHCQRILDIMVKSQRGPQPAGPVRLHMATSEVEILTSDYSSPSKDFEFGRTIDARQPGDFTRRHEDRSARGHGLTSDEPMSCDIQSLTQNSKAFISNNNMVTLFRNRRVNEDKLEMMQNQKHGKSEILFDQTAEDQKRQFMAINGGGGTAPLTPKSQMGESSNMLSKVNCFVRDAVAKTANGSHVEGSEYTSTRHLDNLRQEMMQNMDENLQDSSRIMYHEDLPQDSQRNNILREPLYKREQKFRQELDGQRAALDEDQFGLRFQVHLNKRREKILRIDGYSENAPMGGAISESNHKDPQPMYINLYRLHRDQVLGEEPQQLDHDRHLHHHNESIDLVSTNRDDMNNYLTQNPLTKVISKFPLKLTAQQRSAVKVLDRLGQGSHAKVFNATYLGTPVALKVYDNLEQASLDAFIGELEAYHDEKRVPLSHPNIVQVIGAYQHGNQSFLLTELSRDGTLHDYLKRQISNGCERQFLVRQMLAASRQIASALAYLHEHAQLHHRDLKAENVLVFGASSHDPEQITVKLCDFGVSKRKKQQQRQQVTAAHQKNQSKVSISPPSDIAEAENVDRTQTLGTIPWMAPEFIEHRVFLDKSDVYSFGIMLYEIFKPLTMDQNGNANFYMNTQPYPELAAVQIMYQVVNQGLRPNIETFQRRTAPMDKLLVLMQDCWAERAQQRPSAIQLVERVNSLFSLQF